VNQSGFGTNGNAGVPANNPGSSIVNAPAIGLGIANSASSLVDYNVTNSTFWGANGGLGAVYAVSISGAATVAGSRLNGTFSGNRIGLAGVTGSGCSTGCAGLGLLPGLGGTFSPTVTNNDIRQTNSVGINYVNNVGAGAAFTSSVRIKGNTIAEPDTTGAPALQRAIVVSPGNSGGANNNVCAEIGGAGGLQNTISGAWQTGFFIRVTNNNNLQALRLPGLTPIAGATAADVNAFVAANNTGVSGNVGTALGTAGIVGGAVCP
jgi:hypothetical protein